MGSTGASGQADAASEGHGISTKVHQFNGAAGGATKVARSSPVSPTAGKVADPVVGSLQLFAPRKRSAAAPDADANAEVAFPAALSADSGRSSKRPRRTPKNKKK